MILPFRHTVPAKPATRLLKTSASSHPGFCWLALLMGGCVPPGRAEKHTLAHGDLILLASETSCQYLILLARTDSLLAFRLYDLRSTGYIEREEVNAIVIIIIIISIFYVFGCIMSYI
ncbi:hypothetical protein GW17_00044049 [Ensete ventricosum]|nr:hypothetical protein GW17_00044049 [Ensete ventricosum]